MEPARSKFAAALAVLAICAAAFVLRLRGLEFGLPHMTYRDGMVLYTQVKEIRTHDPKLREDEFWGYYPQVTARVAALFPDSELAPLTGPLDLDGHLERASRPWIALRRASVLISLLAVACAYSIARRFMPVGPSLMASWLVATSLLHLSFSQQEKPHGPVSGTVALALAAALAVRARPGWGRILLAAAASAIALCTLQSGVFVYGALGAAWVIWLVEVVRRHERWPSRSVGVAKLVAAPILALAIAAAAVRFFYPFHFVEHAASEQRSEAALDLAGHPLFLSGFDFTGWKVVLSTLISYDPTLLVLETIGVAFFAADLARKRRSANDEQRKDSIVVLAFALPFLLVLCAYDSAVTFERFLMPLMACFACLAAYGAFRVARCLPNRVQRPVVLVPLAVVALLPATAAAWKLGSVRAAPDTWTQVARWIRGNAQPSDPIHTMPYIDLPLFKDPEAARASGREVEVTYWSHYLDEVPPALCEGPRFRLILPKAAKKTEEEYGDDPIGHLRAVGAKYVVIQAVGEDYKHKLVLKLRKQLATETERAARGEGSKAQLVFRTSPIGDPRKDRGQFALRYTQKLGAKPLALRVFEANCYGNTVEVYRLAD